jgi:hypothetical protein
MHAVSIGVMQLVHDADRIKYHHEMLRQESQRIDLQLGFAQPDRAGFCDSEHRARDTHIDIIQFGWCPHPFEFTVTRDFASRGADNPCVREQPCDQRIQIPVGRMTRSLNGQTCARPSPRAPSMRPARDYGRTRGAAGA